MFGSWIENAGDLQESFNNGNPYRHVIIDDFFSNDFAEILFSNFPKLSKDNHTYWNPIEKKQALNKFDNFPDFKNLFEQFNCDAFIDKIKQVTGFLDLEKDPYLHGSGVHLHPRGGKLDLHVDYSIHPITKKERRKNIIIYMNKDWKEQWGGSLELWSKIPNTTQPLTCEKIVIPSFNTAILFQTSDNSIHGLPSPITCPEDTYRKSIAIYYVSEARPGANPRSKAVFSPVPTQPLNIGLKTLYEIRGTRLITKDDIVEHFPDWETSLDGKGYWYI